MSLKSQNSGTKRISPKALWLRQYFAVSLRALSFVALIFSLWARHAGQMAKRFSWIDCLTTVGGCTFGQAKTRCHPTNSAWKRRTRLIGSRLNGGEDKKSSLGKSFIGRILT